ncbi:ead/Ea22-like family protein [Enterobacter sichuanensis]|uniref:ead/Ea22-like family protein n=1 Tax=Enterobacter sichuanensis TaxID=2071710 RepID=UPI00217D02F5|nr:ead/Ea22-like family protein [Enterobacter sichuanensis]
MSNIDKRALREAAEKAGTDNHTQDEWFHYLRCSTPATVLALLDELEAKDQRIADQCGIIASARRFISEYAGLGDVGAAEFIKIIDRAAGKGE